MEFARFFYLHADLIVTKGGLQGSIFASTFRHINYVSELGLEELVTLYWDLLPSFRTVARWIQHFTGDRESVEDEARVGGPRTSVTDSSVERAEALQYNTIVY